MTTPQNLDERFREAVSALQPPPARRAPGEPVRDGAGLTGSQVRALFDAQLISRHLDLAARWLRSFNEGFYTIGSSGHEGNAAVAAALRADDPALLHYRSAAFYCVRAVQAFSPATSPASSHHDSGDGDSGDPADPLIEAARDVLRGVVASAREPIAGGRDKVLGRADLRIIPTTATVASHLPRAVGAAFGVDRVQRIGGVDTPWPDDAVVACSFGDASVDHATATAALNTAGWYDHSGVRLPLLLICEDNGLGGSVPSPAGWVAEALRSRPGIRYTAADGCELLEAYEAAVEAVSWVREHRRPAVLHLSMVRLLSHAGADTEAAHRAADDIAADLARDPIVGTARLLVDSGARPGDLISRYDEMGWQVRKVAEEVLTEPKLATAAEVVAPLAPRRPLRAARSVADAGARAAGPAAAARALAFGGKVPEQSGPLTLAQTVNATLTDAMLAQPGMLVFGADVAARGGVHGVTKHLQQRFGPERVFDSLVDQTSILGLGLGAGLAGLLPVPEIPYLAYLHSAEDQLRGEAATLSFFTSGALRNPMVVRVPGLAYQSYGGHLHNDNSLAVLRDIPGLVLAVPARPADAAPMLRDQRRRRRQRLRVPGAGGALPHPGPAQARRQRMAGPVRRAGRVGGRARADRARPDLPGGIRRGSDHPDVRKRGADVPAGGRRPGHRGVRLPGRRPALVVAAAGRRPGPGGLGHRPGADRRRDPALRRRRRGHPGRARGRRIRGRGPPDGLRGFPHSARSRSATRVDRGRCHHTGCPRPAGAVNCLPLGAPLARSAATVWTTRNGVALTPGPADRRPDQERRGGTRL